MSDPFQLPCKCSKIMKWKIFEAFSRVHMWDCYFLGQNKSYSRDYICQEGKAKNHIPARPRILEITANSWKCFDTVSMLSVFKCLNSQS